ncbi:MAG: hypothetical protein O9972_39730 [Burkholderiales bacterium]|nr:hypothetical protein [Burkholderiales bacterium]
MKDPWKGQPARMIAKLETGRRDAATLAIYSGGRLRLLTVEAAGTQAAAKVGKPRVQPYRSAGKARHGGYIATAGRYPCGSIKPHRNAAGMTYTASRGGGPGKGPASDAAKLRVFGSLDPLRAGLRSYFDRAPCPCCGALTKLRLSAAGKAALLRHRSCRVISQALKEV